MNWRLLAGGAFVLALVGALAFVLANGDDPTPTTTSIDALPSTTLAATTTVPPTTTLPPSTTTVPPTTTIVPPEDRFQPSDIDVFADEVPVLDLRIHEFTDEEFERILEVHLEFHRWLGLHPELITEEIIEMVAVRDTDYWDNRFQSRENELEQNVRIDPGSIDFIATTPLVNGIPTGQIPLGSSVIELITSALPVGDFIVTDATTGEVLALEPAGSQLIEGRAVLELQPGGQWLLSILSA